MSFDYKKEYKEFYMPPKKPGIINIPSMNFVAVRGQGDPNEEDGEYKQAIGLLYAIAYTIKMSYKGNHKIDGYFSYVVPPLEGLWWQKGVDGIDYSHKESFSWIAMIRLPEFVTKEEFDWAIAEATTKKNMDFSKMEFLTYDEGKCVQCMHIGSYDEEPATIERMDTFAKEQGYELDMNTGRYHHEIYLSDPRRCAPEKIKTVIRHPIRKSFFNVHPLSFVESTKNDNELLQNLDKLHTTELGIIRIKRNLSLDTDNVVEWCKAKIKSENASIEKAGKNWYIRIDDCIITVNSYSYTIITAHKNRRENTCKNDLP